MAVHMWLGEVGYIRVYVEYYVEGNISNSSIFMGVQVVQGCFTRCSVFSVVCACACSDAILLRMTSVVRSMAWA